MKIVIVGLISLILGCAARYSSVETAHFDQTSAVFNKESSSNHKIEYFLILSKIDQNGVFYKTADDTYEALSGGHKLIIRKNKFNSRKEAIKYIYTKRTYLHQSYATLIAPYFGIVKANDECMKLVDVSGNIENKTKDSEFTIMKFVVNKNEQLIDCYSEKPSATVKYFIYLCHSNNTVFDVRLFNKLNSEEPAVNLICH